MAAIRRQGRLRPALNDENALGATTRVPGKAALGGTSMAARQGLAVKSQLAANKSTTTSTLGVRKRAALGEVNTNANHVGTSKQVDKKPSRSGAAQTRSSTSATTAEGDAPSVEEQSKPRLTRRTSGINGHAHTSLPLSTKTNIPRRVGTSLAGVAKPASRKGKAVKSEEQAEVVDDEPVAKRPRKSHVVEEPVEEVILPPKDAGWEDLDVGDEDDPMMVTTYVSEVYDYLKVLEVNTQPDADYMERQGELTWTMRRILIDWLVDVHSRFRLLPETIYLAAHIVDRFLSVRIVSLVKFQLVGVAALFIAAKYEEVVCPSVRNFLFMTDGGYEEEEILKAERYVLQMIGFDLSYPNPIHFLRRISKADGYDVQTRTVAKYFLEMTIVDHSFLSHLPSVTAAAATWLARKILSRGEAWDANLVHYSTYTEEELLPTAQLMLDFVVRNIRAKESEAPQFHKKYSVKKYFRASEYVKTWAEEQYQVNESMNIRLEEWAKYPSLH